MKKLLKAFTNLPPDLRIILSLFGLGSMALIVSGLVRGVRNNPKYLWAALIGIGVLLVAVLLVVGIIKLFRYARRKRAAEAEGALTRESSTLSQSMDVRAAAAKNNAEFREQIKNMRKAGVDVFDLPWYIVIGEPACGKTRLIEKSGLTFSMGKPDGYQLGTLSYNWWFTEDAIFIDMAGRLVTPEEDRDHREWTAFLDTIAKGRKGFPINGALVCVSASHLLEEPMDVIEQKANITLERLRELQDKLGVTFATYLVVTKCDLILGFMQFFDRTRTNVTLRSQIFGWSKPGSFDDSYDPQQFEADFGRLYERLNDLRLSRLDDDASEIDLGLAHSFPEEFRSVEQPLEIYVRTLFPLLRRARVAKNLIFRGVYFTSATQEGKLLLKSLTARLGEEAADQFPPLDDMYPSKKPHFIKDLLLQKVTPEQGIVFPNEQQVVRNRKLNKYFKVGTSVLAVVLSILFVWSWITVRDAIVTPTESAKRTQAEFADLSASQTLERAAEFETLANDMTRKSFARMALSGFFADSDRPVHALERIRMALIEKAVGEALVKTGSALEAGPKRDSLDGYTQALAAYISWHLCGTIDNADTSSRKEEFLAMQDLISDWERLENNDGNLNAHRDWYFEQVTKRDGDHRRDPARLLRRTEVESGGGSHDSEETITQALKKLTTHLKQYYASLSEKSMANDIKAWIGVFAACERIKSSYESIISLKIDEIGDDKEYQEFKKSFDHAFSTFDNGAKKIQNSQAVDSLRKALVAQHNSRVALVRPLEEAAKLCSLDDAKYEYQERVEGLSKELGNNVWEDLRQRKIVSVEYAEGVFAELEQEEIPVAELWDLFTPSYIETPDSTDDAPETAGDRNLRPTAATTEVQRRLKVISDSMTAREDGADGKTIDEWADQLRALVTPESHSETQTGRSPHGAVLEAPDEGLISLNGWQVDKLQTLESATRNLRNKNEVSALLEMMINELDATGDWGVAELAKRDPNRMVPAAFSVNTLQIAWALRETSKPDESESTTRQHQRRDDGLSSRSSASRSDGARSPQRPSTKKMPDRMTRGFLWEQAESWLLLMEAAVQVDKKQLLLDPTEPLVSNWGALFEQAVKKYLDSYAKAWDATFRDELSKFAKRLPKETTWPGLARPLAHSRQEGRRAPHLAVEQMLEQVLRDVCLATYRGRGLRWGELCDDECPEAEKINAWVMEAIIDKHDAFPFVDVSGYKEAEPWTEIATEINESWNSLLKEIGKSANLNSRFDKQEPDEPKPTAIPWGKLQEKRKKYRLESEKLTQELTDFENTARALLDKHLTSRLFDIQDRYFKLPTDIGWPYLANEKDKLAVVDYYKFIEFLKEVNRAKTYYEDLEKGTTETSQHSLRREFYSSCAEWRRFLACDRDGKCKDDLSLTIQGLDEEVACTNLADALVLDIGLTVTDTFAIDGTRLKISCEKGKRVGKQETVRAIWKWPKTPRFDSAEAELVGAWKGVHINEKKTVLGRKSPLAFPAYLERYRDSASSDRRIWRVIHAFEVEERSKPPQPAGLTLAFDLEGRSLPKPIKALEKPEG